MTHIFELTPEEKAERRQFVGGSEVKRIMDGDWFALWQEKRGLKEPDDLSGKLAVQIGRATEALNLEWFAMKTGFNVSNQQAKVIHPAVPFMRCTLDGWVEERRAVIDAKHTGGVSWKSRGDKTIEEVLQDYTPQLTHNALCTGAERGIISCFFGNDRWDFGEIEIDPFYAQALEDRVREFWSYVESGNPPPDAPAAIEAPKVPVKMREVDMAGSNAWAAHAAAWLANQGAAKLFDASVKELKALVEHDVGRAFGHGLEAKRNKAGSISFKRMED